jgi:simple sugar transport system permease protein
VLIALGLLLSTLSIDPSAALSEFIDGAIGTAGRRADVVMMSLPILLCASGLLLTFTAGLWNIGVEGQVTMGAVFASALARVVTKDASGWLVLPVELLLAMIGGALWALLPALLKTRGNVNEIFGGVALNFIANNILLYFVAGPWKAGNSPQTKPFELPTLLPRLVQGQSLSLPAILIAVIAFGFVFFILRGTHWGLQLRAMGRNEKSAFLLGVRTERNVILSMMLCGALAGLAGAFLVLSPVSRGQLVPGVAAGRGFLGVLLVLLVNIQPMWVPFVALFFGLIPIGALKLQFDLRIDPSFGNVVQSALVFAVLVGNGIRAKFRRKSQEA